VQVRKSSCNPSLTRAPPLTLAPSSQQYILAAVILSAVFYVGPLP
jgi:hypothetical protein